MIQFSRDYQPTQVIKKNNKTLTPDMLADPNLQWSADSTTVTYMAPYNLKANSLQPLKIDLSLLGYTLYYDLVGFVSEYQKELDGNLYTMLGFSYYVPIPYKSKRDSIRIEKNRLKAYYNSPQHFCKSLIENKLLQNGYQLFDPQPKDTIPAYSNLLYSGEADSGNKKSLTVKKGPKGKKAMKEVWLDSCVHTLGDYAIVTGLKGRKFIIIYYSTNNNQPKDLTLFKGTMGLASEIIFGKDTCIIRKDGTVPDNSIIFGKEIGEKKVGAMLPGDYNPAH